jgi:hypothetical protein
VSHVPLENEMIKKKNEEEICHTQNEIENQFVTHKMKIKSISRGHKI